MAIECICIQHGKEIGKPYIPKNYRARLMSSAITLLKARYRAKNKKMEEE